MREDDGVRARARVCAVRVTVNDGLKNGDGDGDGGARARVRRSAWRRGRKCQKIMFRIRKQCCCALKQRSCAASERLVAERASSPFELPLR